MDPRVAVVTGSSSGIGAATALLFAKNGFHVVVNYSRDPARAQQVAAECKDLGVETLVAKADVSNDGDCRALAAAVEQRWGRVDALVNNAGTTRFIPAADLEGLSGDDFQHIYSVNVIGAFQMTRALVPLMRRHGGAAIVNVSSVAAVMGNGSSLAYMASKGALNAMTVGLARALAPQIRVNAVGPGMVETPWMREGLGEELFESRRQSYQAVTPLQQTIQPEDVAEACYWLCTGARKTTGEFLLVDSGYATLPTLNR